MTIDSKDILYIKTTFHKMKSKEDLLNLLNYAKRLLYGEETYKFELRNLNYNSVATLNPNRYYKFKIKKKSGESRIIHAPSEGLKAILRCLNLILSCLFEPHQAANGFVRKKSIVDNARIHEGNYYVYNIDIKDFFSSIDQARVWKCFQLKPFFLNEQTDRLELANLLASLCCTELRVKRINNDGEFINSKRNVLPQGAPTSPILSNIVCQKLDFLLSGVAKRFGLKYSRYADDITFSSLHNVFQKNSDFLNELERIILEQHFQIKGSKVRLQKNGFRQLVTGLVVNEKVNVSKDYVKQIRMWIYLWERYKFERANKMFQDYTSTDNCLKKSKVNLKLYLEGKLNFLNMVKGSNNPTLLNLKSRYNKLIGKNEKPEILKIKLLEKKLKVQTSQIKELKNNSLEQSKDGGNIYHNPKFVVSLLNKFTEETNIKFTTHSWDSPNRFQSFDDFIVKIETDFREFNFYELHNYNKDLLWDILYPFLIQNKPNKKNNIEIPFEWGRYKLKVGYQYPTNLLRTWLKENTSKTPFEFPIPQTLVPNEPVLGRTLIYFEDFINVFKSSIEFRRNEFFYMIRKITKSMEFDFNIQISGIRGLTFYTDTYQVEQAFRRVFGEIRKIPEFPLIKINGHYDDFLREIVIEIIQVGSFCDKPITDDKFLLEKKKGDFAIIKDKIHSLCDWSIESRFRVDDKYNFYKINFLSSTKEEYTIKIDSTEGFKHTFKFYV